MRRPRAGRLIWGMPAAETVLDPHVGCGALTMYATYHMFEGLWEQDIKHSGPISEIIRRWLRIGIFRMTVWSTPSTCAKA